MSLNANATTARSDAFDPALRSPFSITTSLLCLQIQGREQAQKIRTAKTAEAAKTEIPAPISEVSRRRNAINHQSGLINCV
jgi:hypothetical protein